MLKKRLHNQGQEEMVGFALIIIIVAVILLIFLGLSMNKGEDEILESYEVESFIHSFLLYTTDCAKNYIPNYNSIKELIIACNEEETCLDERDACEVLNLTLSELIRTSLDVGENRPIKGYHLRINSRNKLLLEVGQGNTTNNYKSSTQNLGRNNLKISLDFYS